MRAFSSRLGLWRGITFDMNERSYQGDLQLEFRASQCRGSGQAGNLSERAFELLGSFDQRGTDQRPPSRLAPKRGGSFDQACFGAVARQQLRLAVGDVRKSAFQDSRNPRMQRAARLAQQGTVGSVLHQSMLEQIARM